MVLGITGNVDKAQIWEPVEKLVRSLTEKGRDYVLADPIAVGLFDRGRLTANEFELVGQRRSPDYSAGADVVLSFGGDGTLLNTVHEIADRSVPILGINLGRLGFLALVDESRLDQAIEDLSTGKFEIETRRMLRVESLGDASPQSVDTWGVNEVVIMRSGVAGLLTLDVRIDGDMLNSYWADGLIVSTPTGSTAYNLSAGGPIIAPGSECLAITPIAPHSLTERPIVIPMSSQISVSVRGSQQPYVVAVDGRSFFVNGDSPGIRVSRAERVVKLVAFPGQTYFETLRSKLMWGSPRKE